jgi:hypothetical protein
MSWNWGDPGADAQPQEQEQDGSWNWGGYDTAPVNVPDNLYMPGSGAVTQSYNSPAPQDNGFDPNWFNQYIPDQEYNQPAYTPTTYTNYDYTQPENTYNIPYSGPWMPQYMPTQPEGYQYQPPPDDTQDYNQTNYNLPDGTQIAARNDQTGQELVVPQANPDDFFGNLYRAAVLPSEVNKVNNDRQGKMPWDVGFEALGNLAEGTFGALGEALKPAGQAVDTAADSNIPVLSQAAQGVRGAVENVVEPVFNFTPSVIGDISKGQVPGVIRDAISNLNPFDNYDMQSITQAKTGYVQDAYNTAIQSGLDDARASEVAQGLDRKLSNFAQLSEYQGLQQFGTLPALAQLGIMLADPVANLGAEAFIAGRLPRGLTEGRIAESTLAGRLGTRAVEGAEDLSVPRTIGDIAGGVQDALNTYNPMSRLSRPADYTAPAEEPGALATGQGILNDYDVQLGPDSGIATTLQRHADDTGITGQEAIREFLHDPTSPVYKDNLGISPEYVDRVEQVYNALPSEKVGSDSVLQPGEEFQTPGKAEFGYNAQDTEGTIPFDETGGKNLPNEYNPPEPNTVTQEMLDANARGAGEFQDTFTQDAQPKAPLPEKYGGVQLPGKGADVHEFFGSARQVLGVDKGVLVPDTTRGTITKPVLKELRPLEQIPGAKPLQVFGDFTNKVFARPFLNSFSRMVRDPLGNYAKLAVVAPEAFVQYVGRKLGLAEGTNSRFKLITDMDHVPQLGPASAAADVSFGKGANSPLAAAWYILANPQNEIPALLLKKLTGGKFTDPTTFIERSEEGMKGFLYKKEFLRNYDNAISKSLRSGRYRQLAAQHGLSEAQLADAIKGTMPAGADLGEYADKVYNPANLSDDLRARPQISSVLDGTAGPTGDLLSAAMNSFKSELDAENGARAAAREKELKIINSRVKDPVVKARRLEALDKPPYTPLDNIVPGSELWNKIDTAFKKELDQQFTANAAASVTPEVMQAYRQFTNDAIAYTKRSGDLSAFRQTLESDIASREAAYGEKYGNAAPAPATTPQTRLPGTKPKAATKAPALAGQYSDLQQKALDWANKRYQLTSNRGVTDASKLDEIAKSNKGRGIQKSQIKKWLDGGELGKGRQSQALMYEEGHEPPVYWMSRNSKAYDPANEVPRGKQAVEVTAAPEPTAEAAPQAAPDTINQSDMQGYYEKIFDLKANKPTGFYSANAARDAVNRGNYQATREGLLKVDDQIRKVTGNKFQLDLETLTPIGRPGTDVAGYYLTDLAGHGKPYDTIKPILPPKLPKELEGMDMDSMLKAVEDHYGSDAYKSFSVMDPAEADARFNEIADTLFHVKPIDPLATMNIGLLSHDEALKLWGDIKGDISERYKTDKTDRIAYQQKVVANQEAQQSLANQLKAEQNRIVAESHRAGYGGTVSTYFDYRNKNKVDQLLGSILPFQYWARQNFAFVARHFAQHPAHYAAILNFYQQLEKENSDPNIPDYAKGDIFLWQNPDGSKVMWDFSSILPFNPLGSNDSVMQVVSPGDSTGRTVRNTDPLAILFGTDIKSAATGKTTGRDKGIIPSFLRPNPILELAFKTGNVNNLLQSLGLATGDNSLMGQDYTEQGRAQKETSGIIPGNSFYQEIGAATGATKALRQAGIIKGDLSPQSLLDEPLFGLNAGKPQTKLIQELTSMAQRKEISPEQAKLAIAGYKEGNWTPEALKALDLVQGENAQRRLLTNLGFTTVVTNTPRQQLTNKLYTGLSEAYDGNKATSITDENGKKIYVPSDASTYYTQNPGASVLTASSKDAGTIRQGLADDKTRQAYSDLVQKSQAKQISARDFNLELAKLQATNPQYFVDHPLKQGPKEQLYNEQLQEYQGIGGSKYDELAKRAADLKAAGNTDAADEIYSSREYRDAQTARNQFMLQHPDFKKPYIDYLKSQGKDYKEPDPAQQEYYDKLDAYNKIGGAAYDTLSKQLSDAYNRNDKKAEAAIFNNPVYQRGKASRDQFLLDNPSFNQQYKEYLSSKGYSSKEVDPNAPLTGTSKSSSSSGSSSKTYYTPAKKSTSKSYTTSRYTPAKKSTFVPYAQYKAQQAKASGKATTTRLPSLTGSKASTAGSNTTGIAGQTRAQVAALTAKKGPGVVGKVASVPTARADDLTTRGWDGSYFPKDFGRADANVWQFSGEAVQDAQKLMAQDDQIVAVAVYSSDLKGYFVYTKPKTELTKSDISLINSQNSRIGLPPTTLTAKPLPPKAGASSTSSINNGNTIAKSNSSGYTTRSRLPYNLGKVLAAGTTKSTASSSGFRRSGGGSRGSRATRLPVADVRFSPGINVRRPQIFS